MTRAKPRVTWVIPCYNEAERLDTAQIETLLDEPGTHALFVDDGSTDTTRAVLDGVVLRFVGRASATSLLENKGKAEAVRHGLIAALAGGAPAVGYLDADFATPPEEASRILEVFEASSATVAMGARVRRLGAEIDRKRMRHYLGRVFATAASLLLRLPVYDTQCGAKLFRADPRLERALSEPFRSRWAFDVELIGRLLDVGLTADDFLEVPLETWHEVRGSKLTGRAMLSAGLDLIGLARRRRRS